VDFTSSKLRDIGFDGRGRNAGPVSTTKRVKAAINTTGTIQYTKTEMDTEGSPTAPRRSRICGRSFALMDPITDGIAFVLSTPSLSLSRSLVAPLNRSRGYDREIDDERSNPKTEDTK
jgi:hypothetical protein